MEDNESKQIDQTEDIENTSGSSPKIGRTCHTNVAFEVVRSLDGRRSEQSEQAP